MQSLGFLVCMFLFLLLSIATSAKYVKLDFDSAIPKAELSKLNSTDFTYELCDDDAKYLAKLNLLKIEPYPLDLSQNITVIYNVTLYEELDSDVIMYIKIKLSFTTFKQQYNACNMLAKYSNGGCSTADKNVSGYMTINASKYSQYQYFISGAKATVNITGDAGIYTCMTFKLQTSLQELPN